MKIDDLKTIDDLESIWSVTKAPLERPSHQFHREKFNDFFIEISAWFVVLSFVGLLACGLFMLATKR